MVAGEGSATAVWAVAVAGEFENFVPVDVVGEDDVGLAPLDPSGGIWNLVGDFAVEKFLGIWSVEALDSLAFR